MGEEEVAYLPAQWLFTDEEINNSPSILDGVPPIEERCRRAKGVNFLVQAGILLKIPQLTLATASVFFHRFYMRYSMEPGERGIHHYVGNSHQLPRSKSSRALNKDRQKDISLTFNLPEQNIAATALFLASKAEETCRKTKDIVIAVARVAQKNANLIIDEQSKEFWRWKDSILAYEETMLELLTFDVVLKSPYTYLYNHLKTLEKQDNRDLRNTAWAFLNDSCMTTICLRMAPSDIAVAAIYFSAKFNEQQIPDVETVDGDEPWWTKVGGDPDRIIKAVMVMQEFYSDNPLKKADNPNDKSPVSGVEDLERTRLRRDHSGPDGEGDSRGRGASASLSPNARINAEGDMEHEEHDREMHDYADYERENEDGVSKAEDEKGDDDSKLKILANDPALHLEIDTAVNGLTNGSKTNGSSHSSGPKRRVDDMDEGEETPVKKARVSNGDAEESEEGEVEE